MILVYGRYLYWANIVPLRNGAGTIGRARLNGTDVNQKFITGANSPVGVTAAGRYLYWTNHTGTIGRARLDGTDVNEKFIKTAQPNGPDAVVADSGHIYWANDYSIGRANLNGTGVSQRFIAVPNGPSGVAGLAVNSRYIYWTDEEGNEIGRARLDGTGVNQRFITGASFPDAIAADSRYLYWTNQNSDAIGRARLDGTGVNQRFVTQKDFLNLHGVAVDPAVTG
jgi:virginiamycin B lyase